MRRVVARGASVFGHVDELVLGDPGHHAAKACADLFDRMRGAAGACRLERGLPGLVLENPVAREFAGLDVVKHALHLGLVSAVMMRGPVTYSPYSAVLEIE